MSKNAKKLMKILNTDEENLYIFQTSLGISKKFSEKTLKMPYDNIKSLEKVGTKLQPLTKKCSFGKTTGSFKSNYHPLPLHPLPNQSFKG